MREWNGNYIKYNEGDSSIMMMHSGWEHVGRRKIYMQCMAEQSAKAKVEAPYRGAKTDKRGFIVRLSFYRRPSWLNA
jgi:hypothetical protein